MTKEERIKELLDKYEEETYTLAHECNVKINELPDLIDTDLTDEEREATEEKRWELEEQCRLKLEASEQRFIKAIAALEG